MLILRDSKCLVLIGLILLAASGIFAEGTGKIVGKVTDAKTEERMPSTFVTIIGTKIGVNADENGNFVIENLPEGFYDLKASMIGYKSIVKTNVRVIQGETTVQDFKFSEYITFDIKITGAQQNIPTGRIAGKVTDAKTSEGLHNACVEKVGTKLIKLSDIGGNYNLNIRPGTYVLCAEKTGYRSSEMVEVTVVKGRNTKQDFKLEPYGKIVGRVTDAETGVGLPGADIGIIGKEMKGKIKMATDINDGSFAIENVPEGTYSLEVTMIGYKGKIIKGVGVTAGQTTTANLKLEVPIVPGL